MSIEQKEIYNNNPTNEERHEMLKSALEETDHIEDFENLTDLLSPPQDITEIAPNKDFKKIKVGIIGGGLSGMASAFELRKLGFDITIFEMEKKRIGGRVYTYYFDIGKKLYGELGAMRIPVSHETTWHYINTFKLDTRPFVQKNENAFIYIRNKRVKNDSKGKGVMREIYPEFDLKPSEKKTPWQKLMDKAVATPFVKMDPSIRKEILQAKKEYSKELNYLGSLRIRELIQKMDLSEGAIELLFSIEPFLGSCCYNSYIENLQETYTLETAFRYEIIGGTSKLPLSFYNSLMSKKPKEYQNIDFKDIGKVTWKSGKTVTKVSKNHGDDKVIIEYIDSKSLKLLEECFDFVICTIPFSSLRNVDLSPMFSKEKMQAIKEVNYVPAQKTIFLCNERFWEIENDNKNSLGGASYTDLPIQTMWYPNHSVENSSSGVLLASYNLNQDAIRIGSLEDRVRFGSIKRQVEAVHGFSKGYLDKIVKDFKTIQWGEEQGFHGGFCYFNPQQKELFSYVMTEPEYNNRVYFAGEHTSITHGWMQGSLNSGMKAANDLVRECISVLK